MRNSNNKKSMISAVVVQEGERRITARYWLVTQNSVLTWRFFC